jgi:hypothetical protein
MEASVIVIMVLALLGVGLVVYLWITMSKDLDKATSQNASAISQLNSLNTAKISLSSNLAKESSTRIATLQEVVGQVNKLNDSIYGAIQSNATYMQAAALDFDTQLISNVTLINNNINGLQQTTNSINSGLGKFLAFKQNADGTGPPVTLGALPGVANPDVQLIQHVTATMGMTVNDLHADSVTLGGDLNLPKSWKLQAQGSNLCFVHGMNTVACLSDAAQKLQIYQNSDGKAPYMYFNNTGELGTNPGGAYEYTSDAVAAQTQITQTLAGMTASTTAAINTASQTANDALTAATAAYQSASNAQILATSASSRAAILPQTQFTAVQMQMHYPLDGLSAQALASVKGLWALRRLLMTYTGPLMKLTSTTTTNTVAADFYSDPNSALGLLTSDGTSLPNWIGNNKLTATDIFITTLYDQSGKNAHATQTIKDSMPRFNLLKMLIDFGSPHINAYFSLPAGTMPQNNNSWTATWKTGILGTGGTIVCGGRIDRTLQAGFGVYAPANGKYSTWSYYGDWDTGISVPQGTSIPPSNNIASIIWNGTSTGTMTLYVNGTAAANNSMNGFVGGTGTTDCIGRDAFQGTGNNGELYFVSLFQSALSPVDRALVEFQ